MSYMNNDSQNARDDILALQDKVSEGRREFFKQVGQGAVATAVATTAMHMGVRPFMKPAVEKAAAAPSAGIFGGGWKNLFSLKPNYLYMNIGTTGSTPTAILDKYEQWYNDVAWKCPAYATTNDYCINAVTGSASNGVSPFGCNPSEFIQSFTTTDGMMKMLEGQDWKSGTSVLVTNMEHGGGMGPLMCVCNRYGVKRPVLEVIWVNRLTGAILTSSTEAHAIPAVKTNGVVLAPTGIRKDSSEKIGYPQPAQVYAKSTMHPDQYFWDYFVGNQFKNNVAAMSPVPVASMISSPPYLTGVRLPEQQYCNYMSSKSIRTTIDAAHLTGMINIDLHKMGVDFFAGSGHKWHCGPGQTGIAYIRNGTSANTTWTFNQGEYGSGLPRTGNNSAYTSGTFAMPKYWVWNDSFRNSQYMVAPSQVVVGTTPTRQFWGGYRDPAQNPGQAIQSIGNNSIPLNRSLAECVQLWNTIGRQNVENYVVTLAQYLRWLTATNDVFDGEGNPGSALYAHVQDFRKEATSNKIGAALGWDDVWNPVLPDGSTNPRIPSWVSCGLTGWNPIRYTADNYGSSSEPSNPGPDYNRPLTWEDSSAHNSRTGAIITYLNNTFGMYTRNTTVPHMMRFSTPVSGVNSSIMYAANANSNFRPSGGTTTNSVNRSQPFRLSTHLFHDLCDIDQFNYVWSDPDNSLLREMLVINNAI